MRKLVWGAVAAYFFVLAVAVSGSDARAAEIVDITDPDNEMTGQAVIDRAGRPDAFRALLEQAVGFYSSGSLVNASFFPLAAPGLLKILRPRDRAWATADLVQIVSSAAMEMHSAFGGERLQIADVAQRLGGRVGEHRSHQNGLDADLVYFRVDRREQDPEIGTGLDETFVRDRQLSPNFDLHRNWTLVNQLVLTGRVNRIFVDGVIKMALCDHAKSLGVEETHAETLRRLRLWPGHDNHMHVRITCPAASPRCISQDEPPPGSGCDSGSDFYR